VTVKNTAMVYVALAALVILIGIGQWRSTHR